MPNEPLIWTKARKLQALAQTGLTFAANEYDLERYHAVAEIAAQLMAEQSGTPLETFRKIFTEQDGYATPKVDVRAAAFRDGKILLVQESSDGQWTLPGGWADVNDSPTEAVERELVEESGSLPRQRNSQRFTTGRSIRTRRHSPFTSTRCFFCARSRTASLEPVRKHWRWTSFRPIPCRHYRPPAFCQNKSTACSSIGKIPACRRTSSRGHIASKSRWVSE